MHDYRAKVPYEICSDTCVHTLCTFQVCLSTYQILIREYSHVLYTLKIAYSRNHAIFFYLWFYFSWICMPEYYSMMRTRIFIRDIYHVFDTANAIITRNHFVMIFEKCVNRNVYNFYTQHDLSPIEISRWPANMHISDGAMF